MSRKKYILVSAALALLLISITAGFALNRPDMEMTHNVSIMTCNIGDIMGGNPLGSDSVAAYLQSCGVPDVLLLQEVRGEKEAAYLSRQLDRPYFVFLEYARKKEMGIAILSRLALANCHTMYFESSRKGAGVIAAEIYIGQTPLLLVNVHLDRFQPLKISGDSVPVNLKMILGFLKKEIWGESIRSQSVRELMHWLDQKNPAHVVLGGDFNTIPFSKTIRLLKPRFDDVLWPFLDYFTGTYKKLDFPIAPRIDFLFVSASLERKHARVVPMSPGDHFPVRADILLPYHRIQQNSG